jgi:hypothetical protein
MSMTDIPILHCTEVAHVYPQSMIPIFHEVMIFIHLYRDGEVGKHYKTFPKFH